MQIVNMFGETVEIKEPSKKTKTMQERYGVIEGKVCKTCEHCYAAGYNRRFYKCELWDRFFRGSSEASDIRLKNQACKYHIEKENEE